jgi:hypothetical protein
MDQAAETTATNNRFDLAQKVALRLPPEMASALSQLTRVRVGRRAESEKATETQVLDPKFEL